jgi:hypothetical protein
LLREPTDGRILKGEATDADEPLYHRFDLRELRFDVSRRKPDDR